MVNALACRRGVPAALTPQDKVKAADREASSKKFAEINHGEEVTAACAPKLMAIADISSCRPVHIRGSVVIC